MKTVINFFGSLQLAIVLIGVTALFVVVGTLIESKTESHSRAAYFTYSNPAFLALLALFFINILASSLKRWPFQLRHIPFLTTHLGLLMILAGVMIKTVFGVQGTMLLWEGSGSEELLVNQESIRIEDRKGKVSYVDVRKSLMGPLNMQLIAYAPHSRERIETWIKGEQAVISGLPPIPVYRWSPGNSFPQGMKGRFLPDPNPLWEVVALRSEIIEAAAKALFQDRISTDHSKSPLLAIIQDIQGDTALFYFNPNGRMESHLYRVDSLNTIALYDEGFGGYTALATFPFEEGTREDRAKMMLHKLEEELTEAGKDLSFPLAFLREACKKASVSFPESFAAFLSAWDKEESWLYWEKEVPAPELFQKAAHHMDWDLVSSDERQGLHWVCSFFALLDPLLKEGKEPLSALKELGWPLPLEGLSHQEVLEEVTRQLFSVGHIFPSPEKFEEKPAVLYSAYLRAYGIHLKTVVPLDERGKEIILESPMTLAHRPLPSLMKSEENVPLATLLFRNKKGEEKISLSYDRLASRLCWPILEGTYLVRFQPKAIQIPYHLRLKEAKTVFYPDSQQPFSYACALTIQGLGDQEATEATLSMNRVYETWDGYRFYLAGISPSDPGVVKRVQLIVNYDPAKYILTYPGGVLVAVGILLLFWFSSPALLKIRNRKDKP